MQVYRVIRQNFDVDNHEYWSVWDDTLYLNEATAQAEVDRLNQWDEEDARRAHEKTVRAIARTKAEHDALHAVGLREHPYRGWQPGEFVFEPTYRLEMIEVAED
jgi:hypothetical protein